MFSNIKGGSSNSNNPVHGAAGFISSSPDSVAQQHGSEEEQRVSEEEQNGFEGGRNISEEEQHDSEGNQHVSETERHSSEGDRLSSEGDRLSSEGGPIGSDGGPIGSDGVSGVSDGISGVSDGISGISGLSDGNRISSANGATEFSYKEDGTKIRVIKPDTSKQHDIASPTKSPKKSLNNPNQNPTTALGFMTSLVFPNFGLPGENIIPKFSNIPPKEQGTRPRKPSLPPDLTGRSSPASPSPRQKIDIFELKKLEQKIKGIQDELIKCKIELSKNKNLIHYNLEDKEQFLSSNNVDCLDKPIDIYKSLISYPFDDELAINLASFTINHDTPQNEIPLGSKIKEYSEDCYKYEYENFNVLPKKVQ